MVEPQSLLVKSGVIARILEALNGIRVRNFHRQEPINISSFSLDNPTLTLHFTTWKNKSYVIKMGLINPIDNSAYLTVSSQDQIYQIDPLEMALESYDLAQLVESKILALNPESLSSLELYQENNQILKIVKKADKWLDHKAEELSEPKVRKFFEQLENLKSTSILDDLTNNQKEFLNKVMTSPAYTLKLISNQGVRNYLFGQINGSLENTGLPKEVKDSFVMTSEDRDSFVLLNSEQIRIFQIRGKDFK
jgi:hypothetical protein